MIQRANYFQLAPEAMQLLMKLEAYLAACFTNNSALSTRTWQLVKLRISQMNQCAFCIDMHTAELTKLGETPMRMLGLNAWRDMPGYSKTEQQVLDFAEQLTLGNPITDDVYQQIQSTLDEKTLVDLTLAINAINSWNRIAKTFKPEVGSFTVK